MKVPQTKHRRGFALITAVTLIGLVAMALAAVSLLFSANVRRTRDALADAQLRQLLLAGAQVAMNQASSPASVNYIPLPGQLVEADLSWKVSHESDGSRSIHIDARVGTKHLGQAIEQDKRDAKWIVTSARID